MLSEIGMRIHSVIIKTMRLEIEPSDLKGDDLIHNYGITSVDALEILIGIEAEFQIQIDDDDLSQQLVSSTKNLEEYVMKRLSLATLAV